MKKSELLELVLETGHELELLRIIVAELIAKTESKEEKANNRRGKLIKRNWLAHQKTNQPETKIKVTIVHDDDMSHEAYEIVRAISLSRIASVAMTIVSESRYSQLSSFLNPMP